MNNQEQIALASFSLAVLLFLLPLPIGYAASAPQDSPSILLGIYDGNQGFEMKRVVAVEKWQSKKYAIVNLFTNWADDTTVMDSLFRRQLPAIWNNGNVPMITWEPFVPPTTPDDIEVRIAQGEFDQYIHTWANRLKKFLSGPDGRLGTNDDRRVYLRLGHEMNGNWYPWSAAVGGNTPADFVAMWFHVKNVFKAKGLKASHVQWVWCVNHNDVGDFAAEEFFPGDAYVDWVAMDVFNWGASQPWSAWRSLAESCDDMVSRIRNISNRPLALTEVASSSVTDAGNDPALKGQWIMDLLPYLTEKEFAMVVWFNEDKETDWAIFGGRYGTEVTFDGKQAYSEYRITVADPVFVSATTRNSRLLSNARFTGSQVLN